MAQFGKVMAIFAGSMLAGLCFANTPQWTLKSDVSSSAKVVLVKKTADADIVVLDSGTQSRLLAGMVCSVLREGNENPHARIVLVDSTSDKAAGLIVEGGDVQEGDVAYIGATPAI